MLLDKSAVVDVVKVSMTSTERKKSGDIDLALGAALDDLSQRLRSQNFISSYTKAIAVNDREVTLTGNNRDLKHVYAIKIGSGSNLRVLEYTSPDQFVRKYDEGDTTSGYVSRFTILTSSEGFPVIRFDIPSGYVETMTIYYSLEVTPDNIAIAKSKTALVAGTLAYFYGTQSAIGTGYYAQFEKMAALARAADTYLPKVTVQFQLSQEDKDIRSVLASRKAGRR